ncbi:MAG: TolC family protein [Bacteroidales bacterium]|nr:TolC family protein [Bacteroidales bacterium]
MKRLLSISALMLPLMLAAQEPRNVSLAECLEMAAENAPAVRSAHLDALAAKAQVSEARLEYLPKISLTALGYHAFDPLLKITLKDVLGTGDDAWELNNTISETARNYGIKPYFTMMGDGYGISMTAMQPIYAGGRIRSGNKLAGIAADAAAIQEGMAMKAVRDSVESKYWRIVALQEKEKTLAEALKLLDELQKDAESARSAGLLTGSTLLELNMRRSELASGQIRLRGGIALLKMDLLDDIGFEYGYSSLSGIRFSDSLEELPSPSDIVRENEDEVVTDEARLLGMKVEAEKLKKRMETGELLPQVALGAGYGYGAMTDGKEGSFNGLLFATVQIPVTDIWKGTIRSRRLDYSVRKAEIERDNLGRKILLQIRLLRLGMETAWEDLKVKEEALRFADETLRTTKAKYDAGMATAAELMQVSLQQVQAAENLCGQQIRYRNAVRAYLSRFPETQQ